MDPGCTCNHNMAKSKTFPAPNIKKPVNGYGIPNLRPGLNQFQIDQLTTPTTPARATAGGLLFPSGSSPSAPMPFQHGRVVDRVRALLTMPVTARTTVPLLARFPQLLVIEEIPPGMVSVHRFSLVGPHSAYCRHRWGKLPSQ